MIWPIIFKYNITAGSATHRPIGSLILQNGNQKISVFAVIDSGADFTVIPKSMGEVLGLAYPQKRRCKRFN